MIQVTVWPRRCPRAARLRLPAEGTEEWLHPFFNLALLTSLWILVGSIKAASPSIVPKLALPRVRRRGGRARDMARGRASRDRLQGVAQPRVSLPQPGDAALGVMVSTMRSGLPAFSLYLCSAAPSQAKLARLANARPLRVPRPTARTSDAFASAAGIASCEYPRLILAGGLGSPGCLIRSGLTSSSGALGDDRLA